MRQSNNSFKIRSKTILLWKRPSLKSKTHSFHWKPLILLLALLQDWLAERANRSPEPARASLPHLLRILPTPPNYSPHFPLKDVAAGP